MEQEQVNVNEQETTEQAKTSYTREEVLALIQSESDKRVQQALKTQQKKHEKEMSLSRLDGDERAKAEKDNRIAELEEIVAKYEVEKNVSEIKSVLSSRNLSAEFADIIKIDEDIEASQERIDKLDKLFKAAVTAEVERRLAATGGAPKGNGVMTGGNLTKEQFSKMSLHEQAKVYSENKELYEKLTK